MGAEGLEFSWCWQRQPTGCTATEFSSLCRILSTASLDQNSKDSWSWAFTNNGLFTVKKLNSIIDEQTMGSTSQLATLHHKLIPKKVEVFIWRMQHKCLPVKMELDKREIDLHSVRCPVCDDDLESLEHALVSCKYALEILDQIHKWWNIHNTGPFTLVDLISNNCPVLSTSLDVWQALKWIGLYCIWKNRNHKVFKGKPWNTPMIFNEIQSLSYLWIANRVRGKTFEWLTWISNPSSYLC
ncbi:uncharacterized protein [Rutidosis leptorrhynchoides]|uniref:uncharacterized protein n=1 Tax=Rutidosis leptorrhynchoides TaxID=125765 RepID=UPI003A9A3EFD